MYELGPVILATYLGVNAVGNVSKLGPTIELGSWDQRSFTSLPNSLWRSERAFKSFMVGDESVYFVTRDTKSTRTPNLINQNCILY